MQVWHSAGCRLQAGEDRAGPKPKTLSGTCEAIFGNLCNLQKAKVEAEAEATGSPNWVAVSYEAVHPNFSPIRTHTHGELCRSIYVSASCNLAASQKLPTSHSFDIESERAYLNT